MLLVMARHESGHADGAGWFYNDGGRVDEYYPQVVCEAKADIPNRVIQVDICKHDIALHPPPDTKSRGEAGGGSKAADTNRPSPRSFADKGAGPAARQCSTQARMAKVDREGKRWRQRASARSYRTRPLDGTAAAPGVEGGEFA